jgi:hypothetical protein
MVDLMAAEALMAVADPMAVGDHMAAADLTVAVAGIAPVAPLVADFTPAMSAELPAAMRLM